MCSGGHLYIVFFDTILTKLVSNGLQSSEILRTHEHPECSAQLEANMYPDTKLGKTDLSICPYLLAKYGPNLL